MRSHDDLMASFREIADDARRRHGPERTGQLEEALAEVERQMASVRSVGDRAPSFRLPDALERLVSSEDVLSSGPMVLLFYRGAWCPYCNLILRSWSEELETVDALGASVVAISGEAPDGTLSEAEVLSLGFPVLHDGDLAVAESYGLVWALDDEMASWFQSLDRTTDDLNAKGVWEVAVPATFVVGQGGIVEFSEPHPDYRLRTPPVDVVEFLRDR